MMRRCRDSDNPNYGGRGVTVDPRWRSFEKFLADMGERPEGTTLDRIDGNGNYELSNCRWADSLTQGGNRANNRRINYQGGYLTASEWARVTGLPRSVIYMRVFGYGWTPEETLSTPVLRRDRH
jgi:hypothetical protein